MVSLTHNSLEQQLKTDERYHENEPISSVTTGLLFLFSSASPHNIMVREAIMAEITKDPNCNFSSDVIKGICCMSN